MKRTVSSLLQMLISAVVVGFSAAVLVLMWTILATVMSTQEPTLLLLPAFLAGAIAGLYVYLFRTKKKIKALVAALLMIAAWLLFTGGRPFGLSVWNLWALTGSILSFGGIAALIASMPERTRKGPSYSHASLTIIWMLKIVGYAFFIFVVFFPFYFMITASMKPRAELLNNPLDLRINLTQNMGRLFVGYIEIMQRFNFGRYILNSVIISLSTIILTLIPAISGAYAVTRLQFPGREFFSKAILIVYMFPAILVAIPLYSIMSQLGIRNSLLSLVIVYPAMTIPVALYMLRSYFFTLPKDIEEAAMIDGCNRLKVIFRITLPLSIPAIASVALYVFMIAWNEFLFSFMLIDSPEFFTLSRGVASLNTQETPRQFLMSGAVIITLPVIFMMFWLEKFLAGGLTLGGVKE